MKVQAFAIEGLDRMMCLGCANLLEHHLGITKEAFTITHGPRCDWCQETIGCTCRMLGRICPLCKAAAEERRVRKRGARVVKLRRESIKEAVRSLGGSQ